MDDDMSPRSLGAVPLVAGRGMRIGGYGTVMVICGDVLG